MPMQNDEMGDREASVFHRYTAYLAQRAGGIVLRWTIVGGVLGAALGAVTLTHWAHWPVSHGQGYFVALLGAVSGAVLGRAIGSGRAQMILFQAQLAQHQHDFERKLLAVSAAVQAQPAQSAVPPQPQPAVAPQPQPGAVQAPPAPEAPAAVEPQPQREPVVAEPEPAVAGPAPVYVPEPVLPLGHELVLPELPSLPEPEPVFTPEPEPAYEPEPAAHAPQPEPAPAEVVQLVPRPEEPAPNVVSLPSLSSLGIPPLSGESAAPVVSETALANGDSSGYGWQPEVNGQ